MEQLTIENKSFRGDCIPVQGNVNLLLIQGSKGMLGCGYVAMAAAEKFGHALAIVGGVSTFDDMMGAKVSAVSSSAAALGVEVGMSGKEALLKMA